jgi:ABC-type multidrug transport system ATPase subunit
MVDLQESSPLAVRTKGLRKRFGYTETLRGIDLEVPQGQCFGLFGPNGAGKSTLLRILGTQWVFSAGSVEVMGCALPAQSMAVRSRIGIVFHQSFLRPELTLSENLRFTGELYGCSPEAVERRGTELLERLSLFPRRNDRVGTFSQGMTKRASLARSLLHEPRLWILDEPFSGLDADGQIVLEELLEDFSQRGGTVLLVTHEAERGTRLAKQWVRLEAGKVVERHGTGPQVGAESSTEAGASVGRSGGAG